MARTGIDGDQVQDESLTGGDILDESLTGNDIQDESIQRKDLNATTSGQAVIKKHLVGDGLLQSSTGVDDGTGDVTTSMQAGFYGCDFNNDITQGLVTITGSSFQTYSTLNFNVSDALGVNKYRLNIDFLWGHNSASNDVIFRLYLDGVYTGEELRIEPKDAGTDQRYQNNILWYVENLSQGSHVLELRARPASASRQTRIYQSITEVIRVV
jgi:hypothetical protein